MPRTRPNSRHYPGQKTAERLARWLNGGEQEDRYRRMVGSFITSIHAYLQLLATNGEAEALGTSNLGFANSGSVQRPIKYLLERFRNSGELVILGPTNDFRGLTFGYKRQFDTDIPLEAWGAIRDVITLARNRDIHRIAQCFCGKWFFVKFPYGDRSQKVCSDACRKEQKKDAMREYMRELRKEEKEEALKALKLARKGGKR